LCLQEQRPSHAVSLNSLTSELLHPVHAADAEVFFTTGGNTPQNDHSVLNGEKKGMRDHGLPNPLPAGIPLAIG